MHTRGKVPAEPRRRRRHGLHQRAATWRERADIVFIMVPDTPDVEEVLFGEDGVAAGLAKGKTVVD